MTGTITTESELRANLGEGVVFPSEEQIQHAMARLQEEFDEAVIAILEEHLRHQTIGALLLVLNLDRRVQ